MKKIEIPCCEAIGKDSALGDVSNYLNALEFIDLDTQSWPEFSYKPGIRFAMAHSGDCIFLKFNVLEKYVQAAYRDNNEPVSKDSCVEFFVSPDGAANYYNFEFNCVGACKAGFGSGDRMQRICLPDEIIDQINRQSVIRREKRFHKGLTAWELTVSIPLEVFCYHDYASLKGLEGRGNFYKCGDDLPEPHFIVWNDVKAPKPDFHLPQFFGRINFL